MPMTGVHLVTVAMDSGQFCFYSSQEALSEVLLTLEEALEFDGIGTSYDLILIVSPHHNNDKMELRVETWQAKAYDDIDQWDSVWEAPIDVFDEGLWYGSPSRDATWLDVPSGEYHARISGKGFIAEGWSGVSEPGDSWRLQLWPRLGEVEPECLKHWEGVV